MRGRESKLGTINRATNNHTVAPRAGARIETRCCNRSHAKPGVAPRAYLAAKRLPYAPQFKLETEWEAFRARTRNTPEGDGHPNSASEQARQVALLRIAREGLAHFIAEMARLNGQTAPVSRFDAELDDMARLRSVTQVWPSHMVPGPRVTPAEFLKQLQSRGIGVSIGNNGGLLACPGSLLTEADRGVLRQYKAQIVTLLADTIEVA